MFSRLLRAGREKSMYVWSRRQEQDADSFVFTHQEQNLTDNKREAVHQIFMMQTFQRAFKGPHKHHWSDRGQKFLECFIFLMMYVLHIHCHFSYSSLTLRVRRHIYFKLSGLYCQHRKINCALIKSTPFSVQGYLAGHVLLSALISTASVDLVYCICLN